MRIWFLRLKRCRGKPTLMIIWCATSRVSISPPRPSSATTAASGPRAPPSLRSSLSLSLSLSLNFFRFFLVLIFRIRLDLVVSVVRFLFFWIFFKIFLLIYVENWFFWICLFSWKILSGKCFIPWSVSFLEDLDVTVVPQLIWMELMWFDFESVEILGFGFGIFLWNLLDCRGNFEFYDFFFLCIDLVSDDGLVD